MKKQNVDSSSPVPLYHQIAEAIREQIEFGELSPGDALAPLREAAHIWGVNLHTVRHAYTALSRDGLVESRGARGTRVTGEAVERAGGDVESRSNFIDRIIREASLQHDLDSQALSCEIARRSLDQIHGVPIVHVIECSEWQCKAHAREIMDHYAVDAREWSLERDQEPPSGTIVATYFHYNDIRRCWPHRLQEVHFVNIIPDARLVDRLPPNVRRVMLCERDAATAENLAADLTLLLSAEGYTIEPMVCTDPEKEIAATDDDVAVMVAPRIWASLGAECQSHRRVLSADYVIKSDDLAALGKDMGWNAKP